MGHIRHIAAGDLTHRINADGSNEMALLAGNVRDMQQALANTVSVVRDGADTIYTGAGEIAAGSNDLSSRTEQQAASLEETAASMEQLTATVRQNADNARQATSLAKMLRRRRRKAEPWLMAWCVRWMKSPPVPAKLRKLPLLSTVLLSRPTSWR
jgi:methyl-accepting chemotaxis protein-1 (serine sensor receptor)